MTSYQAMLKTRVAHLADDPAWPFVRSKLAGRDLAARAGVNTPELIAVVDHYGDLEPPTRPAVLKPDHGQSSLGVSLLVPTGRAHVYTDPSAPGARVTWRRALHRAHTATRHPRARVAGPWLIEELVLNRDGSQVTDYKLFVIGGRVEVILQVKVTTRGAYLWRGPDWEPLPDIQPKPGRHYDPTLPPPADLGAMTEAAQRVATTAGTPFIRVDLYDHPDRGPVFGETCLTPTGGKRPFTAEWDARLGAAWEAAQ